MLPLEGSSAAVELVPKPLVAELVPLSTAHEVVFTGRVCIGIISRNCKLATAALTVTADVTLKYMTDDAEMLGDTALVNKTDEFIFDGCVKPGELTKLPASL